MRKNAVECFILFYKILLLNIPQTRRSNCYNEINSARRPITFLC